jgi:predicted nuclease of restriction endonuclease-like (RecB) superfamily
MAKQEENAIYGRIREILESARAGVARTVNTTQVMANWLIGREIVEEEQRGKKRAGYGKALVKTLSARLTKEFGPGFSDNNLEHFRAFFLRFPDLIRIPHAVSGESSKWENLGISHALSGESLRLTGPRESEKYDAPRRKSLTGGTSAGISTGTPNSNAVRSESWQPGLLHPNLSWTHYRTLLRVDRGDARAFYEIEAIKNSWSARELERQINSLLYERLAKSRDKAGLMRLATKGHEIQKPEDVFKDPVVIEFLGLPESHRLVESNLEEALITNLQLFLLELGKGFAFVSRQERITLEGDHFYIDLVFYHTVLKCYVLIDLKVGKLTHADLGQVQLYVNYFDRERRTAGDQLTLGLILCTDKNDAVVKYTLSAGQEKKIFASRYKLHLPSEAELKAELRRELKELTSP